MEIVEVAVREMCDFLCRAGSLDSWAGVKRMVEGTRLHNIIQSRGGAFYVREVTLKRKFEVDWTIFELSGRADGILDEDDGYTVDEIKTTTLPLRFINEDDFPAHRAQVECYACIFALDKGLDSIRTRVTYAHLETEDVTYFYHEHSTAELELRVRELLREYGKWMRRRADFTCELRESASKLKFPHKTFRDGQDEMILAAFRAIKRRERLFVEAPTGIGKTISTVYPAFRALGEGIGKRIFYLTSKTTGRKAAEAAVEQLRKKGLKARSIVLTAKEKCCLCREAVRECDSILCEYSEGHYGRVNAALRALLDGYDSFNQALIEQYAREYKVCPYELSLDVSLWCDIIICDYNYLFDPKVYLRRFFSEDCDASENIFLVDEAHNLASRARDMYSATLRFEPFLKLLRRIPESDTILYPSLRALCRAFLALKRRADDNLEGGGSFYMSSSLFEDFASTLTLFSEASGEWLRYNRETEFSREVTELRFDAFAYAAKCELFDSRFTNYVECYNDEIRVRLLCLDPSERLSERLARGRTAVFFSATLTPLDYFSDLLGGGREAVRLQLDSPFPRENLFLAAMDKISTRYGDRDNAIHATAEVLESVVSSHVGNYIAYFPSYRLMRETAKAFRALDPYTRCIMQKPEMSEADRDAFIRCYNRVPDGNSMLGFAVLGGVFGEGIDLVGERLVGSIIVGVGLAQINTESNIISGYYDEKCDSGFDYAYVYPGMNKVMQAAGRVIRTDTDRGAVILIDDRFATPNYVRLYPEHWKHMRLIGDTFSLSEALERFWESSDV